MHVWQGGQEGPKGPQRVSFAREATGVSLHICNVGTHSNKIWGGLYYVSTSTGGAPAACESQVNQASSHDDAFLPRSVGVRASGL